MASTSNPSSTSSTWNGLPLWPFAILERAPALAPNQLDQPINQGWTFGNMISVTEVNSRAPDTERNIVAAHSYGRQLGRIMDAVMVLIDDLPEAKRQDPAFKQLTKLQKDIAKIKSRSAARRLDRFVADLEELRQTDKAEYQRVATEVRAVLDR
jgi:DNA-directed RNA polymerase subunit H (RpoH/RPB5)